MTTRLPEDVYKATSQQKDGPRVLIMVADNVNDVEFFYPYYRFIEAGCTVDVATPKGKGFKGDNGAGLTETRKLEEIKASNYNLLYIPGGKAPKELKDDDNAIKITKQFAQNGTTIAAFCHGPQVLAEAGVIDNTQITGWPEVQEEIEASGANYVNKETVVDGQFITARWPGDLPAFTAKVLENLYRAGEANKAA